MSIEQLEKVEKALEAELFFREICRNADPSIEDFKSYESTDANTRQALSLIPSMIEEMEQLKSQLADADHALGWQQERWENAFEEITQLKAQLFDMRKRFCDAERLIAWIDDPKRQPAVHAFTEGHERQIAYRFEDALGKVALAKAAIESYRRGRVCI